MRKSPDLYPKKRCAFCGNFMVVAWIGNTPAGNPMMAMLCPSCASLDITGPEHTDDPTANMVKEMFKAVGELWTTLQPKEKVQDPGDLV